MLFNRTIAVAWPFFLLFGCSDNRAVIIPAPNSGQGEALNRTFVDEELPVVEQIASSYPDLTLITKEPVEVDPYLATYCVSAATFFEGAKKRSGPHAGAAVRILMNEGAAIAFRDREKVYPVGAVIVKEKQRLEPDGGGQVTGREGSVASDGVGGMIKRPAGYDPEYGDWEYFYFEDPTKVEQGKITACVECHRGAAATDYVFGGWAANQ